MKKSFDNETNVLYYVIAYLSVMLKMRTVNMMNDFRRLERDVLIYRTAGSSQEIMLRIGDLLQFSSGMFENWTGVRIAGKAASAMLAAIYGAIQHSFTQQ